MPELMGSKMETAKGKKSKVSIIKGDSPEKMIREAVASLGGMGHFVKKGDVVFIKPNMVSEQPPPVTTPPDRVAIVVRMCFEAGAERVLVGDMPAIGNETTSRKVTAKLAMDQAAVGEIVYLDQEKEVDVNLPDCKVLKQIQIPEILLNVDTVINMPV
jgi:uncharacterized protein (DUF362 family)